MEVRRNLILLLVLVLLASACGGSASVLGEPSGELARVDPTGPLADPTPTSVVDPDWAELAEPLPTAAPTAAPTSTPVATATPAPVQIEAPETTARGADAANSAPFEELVANSTTAISDSAVVQVVIDRSVGPGAHNDYSSSAGIIIDRPAGIRRALIDLVGEGWDGLSARNELERLHSNETYEFLLTSDLVYVRAEPRLGELPGGVTWLLDSQNGFADDQRAQFGTVVVTDPNDVVADVTALLQLGGETRVVDGWHYLDVPISTLLELAPGSSVLSLVALDHITDQGIAFEAFEGTAPVRLRFRDGLISKITVDLGPAFAALPAAGGTDVFDGIEISETYSVSFGSKSVLTLPEADDVVDPTDLFVEEEELETCFAESEDGSEPFVETSCFEPHIWEVIEIGRFEESFDVAFPGASLLFDRQAAGCNATGEDVLGVELSATSLVVDVRLPSEGTWSDGDRSYACVLKFAEPVSSPLSELDLDPYMSKVSRLDLQMGQCLRDEPLGVSHFDLVDCAEPHFYEVYERFEIETETPEYPGVEAVMEAARLACLALIRDQVVEDDRRLEWQVQGLVPNETIWNELGNRDVICMATTGQPETGRNFPGVAGEAEDDS